MSIRHTRLSSIYHSRIFHQQFCYEVIYTRCYHERFKALNEHESSSVAEHSSTNEKEEFRNHRDFQSKYK